MNHLVTSPAFLKFMLGLQLVLCLNACKNPEKDFEHAKAENTIESFTEFIEVFPEHILIVDAKNEIEKLKFKEVVRNDSIELYNDFLVEYPGGLYADSVTTLISIKQYHLLLENLNIENLLDFIKENPESDFIDSAKQQIIRNDQYVGVEIKSELMDYSDLCRFDDNLLHLRCSQTIEGTFTTYGCEDMKKKYGHPPMLKVTIINRSGVTRRITLNGFNSLKIYTMNDEIQIPVAFGFSSHNPFGSGSSFGFTVIEKGSIKYEILNNDYIDLAFICPGISQDDIAVFNDQLIAAIKK